MGYCSAVPLQLGAESERAPCPAPVPPICHRSIPNICLFFSSPMQAPPPHHQKHLRGAVLDGPGAYSSWSGLLPTCTNVFVCLSCILPHFVPCLQTSHFFFPAIPHLSVPLLGSVGRSNRIFWAIDALPFEGPTPLSSPKYPSLTFPPPRNRVFLASSLHWEQLLPFSPPLLLPFSSLFCAFHRQFCHFLPSNHLPSPPHRWCLIRTLGYKRWRPCSTGERRMRRGGPTLRNGQRMVSGHTVWGPSHGFIG